jgi:2-oxo-4-hydroxy-4-carboxy-5-ureidoimidazoline decarboxylase
MDTNSIDRLNRISLSEAGEEFSRCCGAKAWSMSMAKHRPYDDLAQLHEVADRIMDQLSDTDWLEAFACHPQIGNVQSLRMKYAGNREWSAGEQSGVSVAQEATLVALAEGNAAYLQKFGFIFIVCATGKTADEMLSLLKQRLPLSLEEERRNAAIEQRKITHLRLDKMEIKS